MRDHAHARLDELKRQYQLGEGQLRELGRQEATLRETLLRISGAIQVLQELLDSPADQAAPEAPAAPAAQAPQAHPSTPDVNRETHEPLSVP
jgi:hypothetical protein